MLFVASTYLMVFVGTPYINVFCDWTVWIMLAVFLVLDVLYDLFFGGEKATTWMKDMVIFNSIVGPTVEELISRFFIMEVFFIEYLRFPWIEAILTSNLFFTGLHLPQLVSEERSLKEVGLNTASIYFSGFLISVIYWFSGFNLFPAIVLHSGMNLVSDVIYYLNLPKKIRRLL